jgi:hypothetical protein
LANPNKTKIMWLGLLFAILTMVMLSYHVIGDEPPEYEGVAESLFELYRLRTAQCLKLGDITKCAPHTLEALIYYTFAEQATRNDNGTVVWMLFGIINRVTLQMGYHRFVNSQILKTQTDSEKQRPCKVPGNFDLPR